VVHPGKGNNAGKGKGKVVGGKGEFPTPVFVSFLSYFTIFHLF
jgi:hypothetical protein